MPVLAVGRVNRPAAVGACEGDSPTSALTYTFSGPGNATDDLEFSNNGGSSWAYTPVANANGCDPAVTHIRVRPKGTMAGASGSGNPFFELRFRVRVN